MKVCSNEESNTDMKLSNHLQEQKLDNQINCSENIQQNGGFNHKQFASNFEKYEPSNRISDSYPSTTKNNQNYMASCHSVLKQIDFNKVTQQHISTRKVVYDIDIPEIKALHREWFPIPYQNEFYLSLLSETSGIKTMLLELDISQFKKQLHINFPLDKNYEDYVKDQQKLIVGMAVYNVRDTKYKYMRYKLRDLFFDNYTSLYIMTIGVANEMRQFGLGSKLVEKIKFQASLMKNVQYIYLHMVTYNKSGAYFYLKNGFEIYEYKKNHYDIEDQEQDAYVFICWVNGGEKPLQFKQMFNHIIQFVNVPNHLYKLLCKKRSSKQESQIDNDKTYYQYNNTIQNLQNEDNQMQSTYLIKQQQMEN